MRIALTGAGGIIGGFTHAAMQTAGHDVTVLGRATGWHLGAPADLTGHDALIHCAFHHIPGRYRGGEGDNPVAFIAANLDGTKRLFDDAAQAGVGRILFLSSRAVHDGHPAGSLPDDLPPAPTTLYGRVKAQAESHLSTLPLHGTAIRATGIYGPGAAHKWRGLFHHYRAGKPIPPRVATELHITDLTRAMQILLTTDAPPKTVNASDLTLDHRDLLAIVQRLTNSPHPLPARADATSLRIPDCTALHQLGWHPGGMPQLHHTVAQTL
ncbi:NAD(P)-dependent oxidoreductase [Paracoccus sp. (in: a-proteobacteria)]|uniref:NAD-dependent epimerase/dehydratase family protein n=1 Tax=Paracoccus sp. TaxID=267 RepID=UPI0026E0BF69|nr:NAD(P)-dependent oxidoreductase [Paracoccus sp. (in: a-proteobacteria)]MDO5647932.1 NAD(P)-dependent oxidoreductase [Paracoccus sp. (in: a-proteobacteria)]